jgi:aryl-alcohol dehydrogenase-like predicted oxidoreductase
MEHKPLGMSGIEVSTLSLGSWRTFERISRGQGVAVMTAAREAGIDFLDDARLDASLGRMGFDYVDLIYAERLPEGLLVEIAVGGWSPRPACGPARPLERRAGRRRRAPGAC